MSIREMKIALTVDLMNLPGSPSTITVIQNAMNRYRNEAGSFQGYTELGGTYLGNGLEGKSISMHFENVTLDLDLITNQHSSEQMINGFDLKGNYA